MGSVCDYCGEGFDGQVGISASSESGGVVLQINGIQNTRSEGMMDFCSESCFKKAPKKYSWYYRQKDCPLKNKEDKEV